MSELEMKDARAFVDEFLDKTRGMDSITISQMVWRFGNKQWNAGFKQGAEDPDFAKVATEDEALNDTTKGE